MSDRTVVISEEQFNQATLKLGRAACIAQIVAKQLDDSVECPEKCALLSALDIMREAIDTLATHGKLGPSHE